MESAMKGRTTFVVAHRLSTLSRADRVIVLDHGRIVEMGTHAELMQKGGFYQEIVEMQIADPKDAALAKGVPA
jgi:ATP-binding cassette subfamily B protein